MHAIVCEKPGGPEVLRYTELDPPGLKPGHVVIEVHATALNGADQLQMKGLYPPPPGGSRLVPSPQRHVFCLRYQDSLYGSAKTSPVR